MKSIKERKKENKKGGDENVYKEPYSNYVFCIFTFCSSLAQTSYFPKRELYHTQIFYEWRKKPKKIWNVKTKNKLKLDYNKNIIKYKYP